MRRATAHNGPDPPQRLNERCKNRALTTQGRGTLYFLSRSSNFPLQDYLKIDFENRKHPPFRKNKAWDIALTTPCTRI
jgi:hypothetical protein